MSVLSGFLIVDKPKGITSHQVVERVRKLLGKRVKVGHTGTLDPLATGVLILALGKATRLSEYLLKQDKCYRVVAQFGLSSPTYDVDAQVKEVECRKVSKEELERVLERFKGEIEQVPPPFSALRVKGKRAYEFAREGKKVELPPRKVKIYSLKLTSFNYPLFELELCCSSGTYVRSLVHDIGEALKCSAVVKELRRTRVGKISIEEAAPLEKLEREGVEKFLKEPGELLPLREITLKGKEVELFKRGVKLKLEGVKEGELYKVISQGKLVGIGRGQKGLLKPEKVLV
jgi:tRNA pseudouridine55 synthase